MNALFVSSSGALPVCFLIFSITHTACLYPRLVCLHQMLVLRWTTFGLVMGSLLLSVLSFLVLPSVREAGVQDPGTDVWTESFFVIWFTPLLLKVYHPHPLEIFFRVHFLVWKPCSITSLCRCQRKALHKAIVPFYSLVCWRGGHKPQLHRWNWIIVHAGDRCLLLINEVDLVKIF